MKNTKMLKKNYEFKNVLSKGKYFSGRYIGSFIKEKGQKGDNLLGIAISSKIAKAVKRNYIKRLIREAYKQLEPDIKLGYSIVFLWKKLEPVQEADFKSIKEDILKILKKSKLLEEKT